MNLKIFIFPIFFLVESQEIINIIYEAIKKNPNLTFDYDIFTYHKNEPEFWQAVIAYSDKYPNSKFSDDALVYTIENDLKYDFLNMLQTTKKINYNTLILAVYKDFFYDYIKQNLEKVEKNEYLLHSVVKNNELPYIIEKIIKIDKKNINKIDESGFLPLNYAKEDSTKKILKKYGAKDKIERSSFLRCIGCGGLR